MANFFAHYSENAMLAISLAQEEAFSTGRDWVDTEHILVGLTRCSGDSGNFFENTAAIKAKCQNERSLDICTRRKL